MKKYLIFLLIVAFTVSMLFIGIGCKEEAAPEEVVVEEAAPEEAAETAPAKEEETIKITLWSWQTGEFWDTDVKPTIKEKYNIEIDHVAMLDADYWPKLKSAAFADELPDIIAIEVPQTVNLYRDYLYPLNSFYEEDFGPNWKDLYIPSLLDQILMVTDGEEMLGALMGVSVVLFWYNEDILNEVGIDVPMSTDELIEAAGILRNAGYEPLGFGGADVWQNQDLFRLIANDVSPGKIEEAELGEVEWTDPVFVETLEIYKNMVDSEIFQEGVLGDTMYMTAIDLYNNDKIAMMINGSWHVTSAQERDKFTEEGSIDFNNDGVVGPAIGSSDVTWAITKNSKNPEAAWKVVKWLVHEGGEWEVPMVAFTSQNKEFADLNLPAELEETWDIVRSALLEKGRRRMCLYMELNEGISQAMQNAATGVKDPLSALQDLQEIFDEIEK